MQIAGAKEFASELLPEFVQWGLQVPLECWLFYHYLIVKAEKEKRKQGAKPIKKLSIEDYLTQIFFFPSCPSYMVLSWSIYFDANYVLRAIYFSDTCTHSCYQSSFEVAFPPIYLVQELFLSLFICKILSTVLVCI